ncbi:MAG TPA: efflux RND transporter periplasmic adaptor subunit [Anaeromyxobacteraceae bacterium]|nr:efflux RND transporter periplasmic adaptor subunit [Anaeromyxobacteraceae bacterium]
MTRTRPALTLAVAAAATLLGACSRHAGVAELPTLAAAGGRAVRVAKPATRIETGLARVTGAVRAKEDATLSAKATGQIRRVRVNVGDRVRAGQALVEMDPTNAQIALQTARAAERLAAANLAGAESDLARSKELFEQHVLPAAAWEKVQTGRELAAAQVDQARAAARAAEQAITDATLVAPFDGVVTAKWRNAGDTVTLMPVTPILALTDLDHLEVRLAVPESIEGFVKPGQKLPGVTTPGAQRFEARVRVKNSVVDAATRTVEVLADVVKVDGSPLRPGTLVDIDFAGLGEASAGVFVPTSAVRQDGATAYVMVVANGKAERRGVEISPVNPGTFAVKGGLDAAADVILDPGALAPGDAVVPLAD